MKKWMIRLALLLGYTVPYLYLSMYIDLIYGTPVFYAAALAGYVILYLLAAKTHNRSAALIGTVWTAVSSYCFMQYGWTQAWEWYFKPFTAAQLLAVLSLAAFFIQLLAIWAAEKKKP
ncbi:hypothetical protein [Anaerotruncus sp.]|jgi:hypothetical protein|nr:MULTISPECIES: hypothetical protein [Anaerotruncus]MCI8491929.1 hypothetical protein [Anaerotruncus sp.]